MTLLIPLYISRSVSASSAPPRPLLPLFPSMTPPPPAPRPSSQSMPQLPAPVAGNLAFSHWLLAMPSARPERRESSSSVSQGRVDLVTPGLGTAGEFPRTHPQDHNVGSTRRQALLAAATTVTALIDTASLLPAPSVALVLMGFMNYGLPTPRSPGPALPWNKKPGEVLANMDQSYNSSLKFHHVTTAEKSGFTSTCHFHLGLADPVVAAGFSAPLSVS